MRTSLIVAGLVASVAWTTAPAQAPPAPEELARRLQARYDGIRSFTADFSQSYAGGLLGLDTTERGRIQLRKPGRFRMEYTVPEKKTFVADGETLKSYFPEDHLGQINELPEGDEASTALLFVAGRGNLVRDFTPALAGDHPAGEWHLVLTPRTPQPEFEALTLFVDRASLALVGFSWTDDQGATTTTRFTGLRENVALPDSTFEFSFPPGVVIRR